jgi:hypothetical protein
MRVRPCLWKVRLVGTAARSAYDQNGVGLTDIYSLEENIGLMHCGVGVAQLKTDAEMIVRCCLMLPMDSEQRVRLVQTRDHPFHNISEAVKANK